VHFFVNFFCLCPDIFIRPVTVLLKPSPNASVLSEFLRMLFSACKRDCDAELASLGNFLREGGEIPGLSVRQFSGQKMSGGNIQEGSEGMSGACLTHTYTDRQLSISCTVGSSS